MERKAVKVNIREKWISPPQNYRNAEVYLCKILGENNPLIKRALVNRKINETFEVEVAIPAEITIKKEDLPNGHDAYLLEFLGIGSTINISGITTSIIAKDKGKKTVTVSVEEKYIGTTIKLIVFVKSI